MSAVGFRTHAFVLRFANNAVAVHLHPQEAVQEVNDTLRRHGWDTSIMGPEKPVRGAILLFDEQVIDDETIALLSDFLTLCGVGSYAYRLTHDTIADTHVDAYTRLGDVHPREGSRVLLTHTSVIDDFDEEADALGLPQPGTNAEAVSWVFGAPADLSAAAALLTTVPGIRVDPVETPSGIASLEVRHLEPVSATTSAHEVAARIIDPLTLGGFSGPSLVTDHREDSGLTASY